MQEALTVLFGIGVLTVATIALLNVACLRLHDVQKTDSDEAKDGRFVRLLYAYVYDSMQAFIAREDSCLRGVAPSRSPAEGSEAYRPF